MLLLAKDEIKDSWLAESRFFISFWIKKKEKNSNYLGWNLNVSSKVGSGSSRAVRGGKCNPTKKPFELSDKAIVLKNKKIVSNRICL